MEVSFALRLYAHAIAQRVYIRNNDGRQARTLLTVLVTKRYPHVWLCEKKIQGPTLALTYAGAGSEPSASSAVGSGR